MVPGTGIVQAPIKNVGHDGSILPRFVGPFARMRRRGGGKLRLAIHTMQEQEQFMDGDGIFTQQGLYIYCFIFPDRLKEN